MLTGWCFLLTVACLQVSYADGANILMIPWLNASHFFEMDGVGRPLVDRGHTVYVLFDEHTSLPKGAPYKVITYRNQQPLSIKFDTQVQHSWVSNSQSSSYLKMVFDMVKVMCTNMLSDSDLFVKLEKVKLDLVLVDGGVIPCFNLVPYKLGVPYVTTTSTLKSWSLRVPLFPSIVQSAVAPESFGVPFCEDTDERSSIVRRVCRLVGLLIPELIFANVDSEYLREFIDFPSLAAVRENVSFTLVNANHLLSDPLPKLPNVDYVGGLTTRPARPLEASLAKWMSETPNVVIVSFGSMLGSLPSTMAQKMFAAFGRMSSYRFLWRFKSDESKSYAIPTNVRLMDWLPQNDALGHNSTRLFITHSGNNGQQEALYHGVPMLCFYVHYDQRRNANRVASRVYGRIMSLHEFTADQLVEAVTDLIENATYRDRIGKASSAFHSEKHPSLRAADAVEHVLKFGADHLRPLEAYNLSVWEFYMLDVLAFVYSIILVIIVICWKIIRLLYRSLRSLCSKH